MSRSKIGWVLAIAPYLVFALYAAFQGRASLAFVTSAIVLGTFVIAHIWLRQMMRELRSPETKWCIRLGWLVLPPVVGYWYLLRICWPSAWDPYIPLYLTFLYSMVVQRSLGDAGKRLQHLKLKHEKAKADLASIQNLSGPEQEEAADKIILDLRSALLKERGRQPTDRTWVEDLPEQDH